MNIPEVWHRFKSLVNRIPEEVALVTIIVLVGVSAFGLGRLSALETKREPVRILQPSGESVSKTTVSEGGAVAMPARNSQAASVTKSGVSNEAKATPTKGEVVASKNSDKYHLPWCGGAKRISEANKITFASVEEAEKAGYLPAANCPGL